jgi:hypothetical protein
VSLLKLPDLQMRMEVSGVRFSQSWCGRYMQMETRADGVLSLWKKDVL